MMKTFGVLLAVTSLALLPPASAADTRAIAMGFGTKSCAEFGQSYAQNPYVSETAYFAWAQGWMSAMNVIAATEHGHFQDMNHFSLDEQKRRIRAYCSEYPLEDYDVAVAALYSEMPKIARPRK